MKRQDLVLPDAVTAQRIGKISIYGSAVTPLATLSAPDDSVWSIPLNDPLPLAITFYRVSITPERYAPFGSVIDAASTSWLPMAIPLYRVQVRRSGN